MCVCWDVEKPQSSSLDRSVVVSVVNFKAWGSELTLQFEGFVCVLLRWLTHEGKLRFSPECCRALRAHAVWFCTACVAHHRERDEA